MKKIMIALITLAFTSTSSIAGPKIEVLHWWTSGGEAAALKVLKDDFEVNLRADLSEYIGHEQIMTFDLANQELLAKFPSTIKIELNKETKLYFDLTQVSLFDANTQERL